MSQNHSDLNVDPKKGYNISIYNFNILTFNYLFNNNILLYL